MQDPRLLLLFVFAGAVGCASTAVAPRQERVDAYASLAAAERLEPYLGTPRIQTHLERARADISEGDRLMGRQNYEVARYYFERSAAASDAAIAWAHAHEADQLAGNMGTGAEQEEESHEPDAE
jgi:hypothetical protein